MSESIFLPLKSVFFNAFLSRTKSYELRGIRAQFTPDNIVTGKSIIVSRGYSKFQRMTGTIGKVRVFNSMNDAMRSDIWYKIMSLEIKAESVAPFLEYYRKKYEKFIAFEIII